jgi:hypothetical protein
MRILEGRTMLEETSDQEKTIRKVPASHSPNDDWLPSVNPVNQIRPGDLITSAILAINGSTVAPFCLRE